MDTIAQKPLGPEDGLAAVNGLRRLADRIEDEAVRQALAERWRWADIADALGVSKQAAHKKHANRLRGA